MPRPSNQSNASIDKYIQTIRKDKKAGRSIASPTDRRRIGALFGGCVGLVYGLVAQGINLIAIPHLTTDQAPFGLFGNIILWTLSCALIGWAAAWPDKPIKGALSGAVVGTILLLIRARLLPDSMVLLDRLDAVGGALLDVLSIPFALLFVLPLSLVLRWAVDDQCERLGQPLLSWRRFRLPVVILVAAAIVGAFALYPQTTRQAMRSMGDLIEAGLAAGDSAELPAPLQGREVRDFLAGARGNYWLQVDESKTSLIGEGGSALVAGAAQSISARFESGYRLTCRFAMQGVEPVCRGSW